MKNWWQQLTALAGLALIYVSPVGAQTWDALLNNIRRRFPTVRHLSTRQLDEWLSGANGSPRPLLVDARPEEEFAVSHLRGAQRFVSVEKVKAAISTNAQPIVVYCSVGYRSSALAVKLAKAGLTDVRNLDGSLFAWANEGRPVYRGDERLDPPHVHPYNSKWGRLLRPGLRGALR